MKQSEKSTLSIVNTDNIDITRNDIVHNFLLTKKESEQFGYIAIKRGYATVQEVKYALEQQRQLFREKKIKKMIGDVLVGSGVLTNEQHQNILKVQRLIKIKREEKDVANNENKENKEVGSQSYDKDKIDNRIDRQIDNRIDKQIDNRVEVTISANGMEAWVKIVIPQDTSDSNISDFNTAELTTDALNSNVPDTNSPDSNMSNASSPEKEKPITLTSIKSALANKGVKNGILSDAILQSHLDRKDDFFPAAVGSYDYSSLPEFQFFANNNKTNIVDTDNNTSIEDFIIDSPIIGSDIVKKGKALAVISSEKVQNKVQDVFGKIVNIDNFQLNPNIDSSLKSQEIDNPKEINSIKEIDCNYSKASLMFRCGKWVSISEFSEDKLSITAEQSGYPALSIEGKFYIFPVVNVLGDADLRFGQIDQYASLNVSGILTGAYPVNVGQVKANEIRGANVLSIGDVSVEIGIINSRIKTQGNVRAKYIHNSRIEAFGDVVVDHEIIDSTIIISGKCNVSKGRVIASRIYAKMGIAAIRVGSNITEPCVISVGCEEHIAIHSLEINQQINNIRKELDELIKQRESLDSQIKEIFEKMVELKVGYDKESANLKEMVELKADYDKANANLKQMVEILKQHNKQKKTLELSLEKIETNINKVKPKVKRDIAQLELDRNILLRWAESKSPLPEIKVSGRLSDETVVKGFINTDLLTLHNHTI
ncbi:MAG: DUF342 domain-containing protein [Desulfamplus sp.]|nr:DUF342 domain-containing protein [Desulfamplus sp.]